MTADEMVGIRTHRLNGHESEPALGDSEGGQGKPGVLPSMGLKRTG